MTSTNEKQPVEAAAKSPNDITRNRYADDTQPDLPVWVARNSKEQLKEIEKANHISDAEEHAEKWLTASLVQRLKAEGRFPDVAGVKNETEKQAAIESYVLSQAKTLIRDLTGIYKADFGYLNSVSYTSEERHFFRTRYPMEYQVIKDLDTLKRTEKADDPQAVTAFKEQYPLP